MHMSQSVGARRRGGVGEGCGSPFYATVFGLVIDDESSNESRLARVHSPDRDGEVVLWRLLQNTTRHARHDRILHTVRLYVCIIRLYLQYF